MKNKKHKAAAGTNIKKNVESFNIDEYIGKYIYLLIPALMIIYYIFSTYSDGFYGDDEIGYAMYMKRIFQDPFSILGNWNKPGYRLFFALPSLLGNKFLVLSHIFLTTLTVVGVFYLGRQLRIKNSFVAALLFAFQPFIMQFSFRCYAEMLAGFLIILTLLFYYKNRFNLSALCATYLFTVRQEYATIGIILGIIFLIPLSKRIFIKSVYKVPLKEFMTRNIIPLFILLLGPLTLNFLGFLMNGDPLWLLHDIKHYSVDIAVPQQDLGHYFRMFIFVIGPVSFLLFLLGFFSFSLHTERIKIFFRQYGMIMIFFSANFILYAIMAAKELKISGGTGALRFMIPLSPLAALVTGMGINIISDGKNKKYIYVITGFTILITWLFLSYKTDRTIMTGEAEFLKLTFIILLLFTLISKIELKLNSKIFLPVILVLGITFTLIDEKPIQLDPEKKCLETVSGWIKKNGFENRQILCNHVYFYKVMGVNYGESEKIIPLSFESLKNSPVGTITIWESHYSYYPIYGAKVPSNYLDGNSNFKLLSFIVSSDRTFKAGLFEKIKEY